MEGGGRGREELLRVSLWSRAGLAMWTEARFADHSGSPLELIASPPENQGWGWG